MIAFVYKVAIPSFAPCGGTVLAELAELAALVAPATLERLGTSVFDFGSALCV